MAGINAAGRAVNMVGSHAAGQNTGADLTEHTEAVKQNQYPYQTGISYSTLYAQCEKLADFAINVTEAIDKIKK